MKYIIVVDKQSRTNPSSEKRETVIDIEELRRKGDVHDDFKIEQGIAKVYRRIGLTKYHVTYVLEEEIIEDLGEIKIKLFEGKNYIYIKDEYNNNMCAEYVIKNDFTDAYVTNLQMESAIEETASMIKLFVGQVLEGYSDTETTKAMIDIKADEIREEVSRDYASKDELEQEKSERVQTANSIIETVSETYSTKTETNQAKNDAIDSANTATDNKLQNYSTTVQMNSAIEQKANSITSSVSETYSTKEETATAKTDAINSANTSTDNKLKNYSTTSQMNSLIEQKADSIIQGVSATYATKTSLENTSKTLTASLELKINKEDLVSELNASADVIKIKSNRLTIDSTYFKLTADGKVECSNISIQGGDIFLTGNENTPKIIIEKDNNSNIQSRIYPHAITSANGTSRITMSSVLGYGMLAVNTGDTTTVGISGDLSDPEIFLQTSSEIVFLANKNGVAVQGRKVQACKNLYNNTSGTSGTVTLSESSANYDYIIITYSYGSIKTETIYNASGKQVCLEHTHYENNTTVGYFKIMNINGTTISANSNNTGSINTWNNTYSTENAIKILRVDGYK